MSRLQKRKKPSQRSLNRPQVARTCPSRNRLLSRVVNKLIKRPTHSSKRHNVNNASNFILKMNQLPYNKPSHLKTSLSFLTNTLISSTSQEPLEQSDLRYGTQQHHPPHEKPHL